VAVLVALAALALLLFFAVGGPLGTLNDMLNAAIGVASTALVGLTIRGARHVIDVVAGVVGVLGGAAFSYGAWLVLSDTTGFFLAGLVSGVGAGLLGVWLLVLNRGRGADASTSRLGLAAGALMSVGLLGLPGWTSGVDDWVTAPWLVDMGMLGWLGTYLIYPVWCLRASRATD
jgi:hypothetical protein